MYINKSYSSDSGVRSLARSSSLIQLALAAEEPQQETKAMYSLPKMRTPDSVNTLDHILIKVCIYTPNYNHPFPSSLLP